ncbi:metal-dependent hydrolase [Stenotrophomonas sp. LGBM10]|uniref:metal-dependent hydrolase n=1 Tax=Stenotrophomonas sp. LGBM10 TaxID=3390038 RepID=UPI00398B4837
MSSIAGHAAAGITAYLCCNRWACAPSHWAVVPFAFLAVCPDLDYLAVWLLGYAASPRVTHSLLFALAASLLVHRLTRRPTSARLPIAWLLAAGLSHPLMDLLVGAHPVPLLWPIGAEVAVPVGLLPSAGALQPGNYYLWRNLVIELGVLLPPLALLVALARPGTPRRLTWWVLCTAPFWAAFLAVSLALAR